MTKQSLILIGFLVFVAGLLGFNYFMKPFAYLAERQAGQDGVTEPTPTPTANPTEEILTGLTPRQRISQLLSVPLTVNAAFNTPNTATQSAQLQWIQENNPGSVVLFGSNVSTSAATTAIELIKQTNSSMSGSLSLVPLIAVDHEGGNVQRLKGSGFSPLPSWKELCTLSQVDAQIALEQSAEELEQARINIVLAPVLDVSSNNAVLGSRICSGDFGLVGERARIAANVYLQHGITPVFKHFPGIGTTRRDLHTTFDTVTVGEDEARLYRELLDFYTTPPNQKNIGVMVAHVGVENQDPTIPCSMSTSCVSQLTDNFPSVLVFSDDVLMTSAYQGLSEEKKSLVNVVLQAITAGNQQIIIGPGVDAQALNDVLLLVEEAYQNNTLIKRAVDHSVAKVIEHKLATMK